MKTKPTPALEILRMRGPGLTAAELNAAVDCLAEMGFNEEQIDFLTAIPDGRPGFIAWLTYANRQKITSYLEDTQP